MGTEHVRRLVAGFAVVGVLAAGCSDAEGEPPPSVEPSATEQTPTTSATPKETATPGPGRTPWPEPTRPAAMERDDIEGAKAAAEYFLKLFTYVHMTGDLDEWTDISHSECMFCANVAQEVAGLYDSGGYANGPVLQVVEVTAAPPDSEYEYYSVWVDADELESARYDANGDVVEAFDASKLEVDMALARVNGEWKVRGAVGRDPEAEDSDA